MSNPIILRSRPVAVYVPNDAIGLADISGKSIRISPRIDHVYWQVQLDGYAWVNWQSSDVTGEDNERM